MASAIISETIRPAYIWTGEEWIQIGDGGGGGSVVGGTNIDVNYNEELNTYTVNAGSNLETIESIDNKFVHEDHVNVEIEYDETSNRIIITGGGGGFAKTSYGTIYPDFEGEEEEIFYQLNEEKTKVEARYVYLDGDWRLFSEEEFNWENLSLQTWQWLLDNSEVGGWEFLISGQDIIGNVDFNTRFVPNLIADIRYLQKNEFGDALVSGSAVVINSLSSGIPTLNGGIKVKRGDQSPVELIWNEEKQYWEFTEDGINYKKLGSGAVLYEQEQPETEDLEIGTLWIDNDQDSVSGLQAQTFSRWIKTLQTSASVFSGLDDDITPLKYIPSYEQVFMNGTLLVRDEDYIANDGLIITLLESGVENDIIEIHSFEPFLIADSYTREQVETLFATKAELDNIDLSPYETVLNASATYVAKVDTQLVKYGSDEPLEPEEGMIWIDSTNIIKPITKVYNGSTWIIASGQAEAAIHPFFLAGI